MLQSIYKYLVTLLSASILVTAATVATGETPAPTAATDKAAAGDDWRFGFELYGYFASMGGEIATGQALEADFDDILDNLQFAFMGLVGAYKGKWSFIADVLYMDVGGDGKGTLTVPITPRKSITENVKVDVGVRSWVVTPTVGYELVSNDKLNLSLFGGARYLWLKTTMEVNSSNNIRYRGYKLSESQDNWDAIAGVRGRILLTDKWFLP